MTYSAVPREERRNLYQRLKARYGEERATEIIYDRDPDANADLKAWRELGRRKDAA